MTFARRVFMAAGIIGLLIVVPMLFMENQRNIDYPPDITHPEFYYGFLTVTAAWQVLFLMLSRDPVRYRMMMVPAMMEKGLYVVAIFWLFFAGRVDTTMLGAGILDLVWGILFVVSFMMTSPSRLTPGSETVAS